MSEPDSGYTGGEIAIVGLSCRFPGASDTNEFWANLLGGVESIVRYGDDQLRKAGVDEALLTHPSYVKAGGQLPELDGFDAPFFGIGPKDAAITDPQHRHFLECAWEALEHAGHPPSRFAGSIGVFAGCGMNGYFVYNLLRNPEIVASTGLFLLRHTGNDRDFLPTTVSYKLNLVGPSIAIQTACSTSLVAIHVAAQNLLANECDLALAGGVTVIVPPGHGYLHGENEPFSPDGHCRAFDARGAGMVLTSGVGVVALRRLADALADGDTIHAIIRGSAVNNDGARKVGYLAPSVDGQASVIAEALAVAGVSADEISYVETHGTGTLVGDPIEVRALTQAFRQTTQRRGFCAIGSNKPNIGHTDTAAGVASLIKVVRGLQARELPPSLHFEQPNPAAELEDSPFFVNTERREWKHGSAPRRAGVSSLGVGGTNAHVILEEAPARRSPAAVRGSEILPLSAKTATALDAAAAKLARHLRESPTLRLADVAHTLQVGREAFEHRRVVVASSLDEAASVLEGGDSRHVFSGRSKGKAPSIVFMFPGGGAHYPDMGFGLYESEPVFRRAMDECFAIARRHLDFDLRALVWPGNNPPPDLEERLARPTASLPAIFAIEYAMAKLWLSWGIEPAALTGHSMGEYTAACLAGVLSLEDALRVVAVRGRLMDSVRAPARMLSVPLPEAELRALLPDDLDLGVVNGPSLCVVCGESSSIDRFEAALRERDIECRPVRMRGASHCSLLDPFLDEFRRCLATVSFSKPTLPYVSNLTGTWVREEDAQSPDYWVRHLREPVLFSQGLAALLEEPDRILLEVGPGQTLASLARQQPRSPRAAIGSLRHPDDAIADDAFLADSFARLWAAGVDVDWSARRGDEQRLRVSLPTYAWEHQRYWIDPVQASPTSASSASDLARRPQGDGWFWESVFREEMLPSEQTGEPVCWLVFGDPSGLGSALTLELERRGHVVTVVREGDAFYRFSEREYALAPEAGLEGYVELVRDLDANGRLPDRIVHLWLVTADESARAGSNFFHRNQERGFYSLVYLAQALAGEDVQRSIHVAVVSNGMQRVGDETLRHPEKATVLGPIGVIPQEFPKLSLQSIDLEAPKPAKKRAARAALHPSAELVSELVADICPAHGDLRIAYRAGRRFVERLEPVAPERKVAGSPLRERGAYLVTGGLGGLGLLLAEHLAQRVQARLVLVSRSPIPGREAWQSWLASHGSTDATSAKLRKLLELEKLGAELQVEHGDVADIERMREVASSAKQRFGKLHGVFHVAGTIDDAPIQAKTQASMEAVLSPKVHGTLVLDEVFHDAEFFALFSSSSSALGAAGQVDYVAASAFLDAFAKSRVERARPRTLSIGWGVWRDVGLAVDAYRRLGGGHTSGRPTLHPFLARRSDEAGGGVTFSTKFHGTQAWLLDDHRTRDGSALIPGTGYLEMLRAAYAEVEGAGTVELRSVFFVAPCSVGQDEDVEVRTLLRRTADGVELEVESRATDGSEWQLHAQAEAAPCPATPPAALALAEIRTRMNRANHSAQVGKTLDTLHARHLRFGPRWSVLREMHFGEGEALAKLELPQEFAADLESLVLHPALLDLATGFATPLIEGYTGEQLFAPMSYRRVRVFAPLTRRIESFVRSAQKNRLEHETAVFDVTICDESGRVLVEIEGFALRKLATEAVLARRRSAPSRATAARGPDLHSESGKLTPAERIFRQSYELGIRPEEGMAALELALAAPARPHVFVSSLELPLLVERVRTATRAAATITTAFARPELETSYLAPRDDVERTLADFWQELLGVDKVGIQDDFFELGGHSLIAVRLFAKIKKAWEIEYPISVLFEAPNIEKCALLIREDLGIELGSAQPEVQRKTRRTRFLVPLQMGAPKRPPFFLVAGMFGNVLNLRHVAQHLGADQTVYAIQAKGLLGDDEPHRRFSDMARDYLEEVRAVQPDGPYFLGGFSGGGLTALEMAIQLLAQEQEIGILVLLDTQPAEGVELDLVQRLRVQMRRLAREGVTYPYRWLRNRVRWEFEKRAARRAPPARDLSPAEFRSAEIEKAFFTALASYKTPHYPGKVVLFRPSHDDWFDLGGGLVMNPHNRTHVVDDENRFGRIVTGGIEVHEVPGDHDAMVLEPHVRSLASKLRACLDESIQAKSGTCAA